MIRLGCAGWSIPTLYRGFFPQSGSHLQRYAERYNAVEINSSFYRSHQQKTYARWKESTPATFAFSVKAPKTITHVKKLEHCEAELDQFLDEVAALEDKLGTILIQLPPSLAFDEKIASDFFAALRTNYIYSLSLEARHNTWFLPSVEFLMEHFSLGRVEADPAIGSNEAFLIGPSNYYRLHGSPKTYYSNYDDRFLQSLATGLSKKANCQAEDIWCMFDNTAEGCATKNALRLAELLSTSV